MLPYSLPWAFRKHIISDDNYITNLLEPFSNSDTMQSNTAQCHFTSTIPEILDWKHPYNENNDTKLVLAKLASSKFVEENTANLERVSLAYRLTLRESRIHIVNKKLVLFKSILANYRHVILIIVPTSLRRKIFSHYHAGPIGGHMGDMRRYIEYGYNSSGLSYGRISKNGYTNVDIAWRIMCGTIDDKSCFSHG